MSSSRPCFQVSITTKTTSPTHSGNQPPSGIFSTLAVRKVNSTARKQAKSATARAQPQPQTRAATTVAKSEVITMSPVTARP